MRAITHPGCFHCDDAMAAAILSLVASHQGEELVWDRKVPTAEELKDSSIIKFDIGGSYDVASNVFDHHQRGGAGRRADGGAPYSSAGLIWEHFGRALCSPEVWDRVDSRLIQAIDSLDNGEGSRGDLSFSGVISLLNPANSAASREERDAAFKQAVGICLQILEASMASSKEWVKSRSTVVAAPAEGRVLYLDVFCQWAEHVFVRPDADELLYVVFPGLRGGYSIQQIPTEPQGFEGRKPLPEEWAGLRAEELQQLLGLSAAGPATFCHPGRFIGGAETLEDVKLMAELAIKA
jgi:uncharacterized UPF0160 family protein